MPSDPEQPFLQGPVAGQLLRRHDAPDSAVDHDGNVFADRGRNGNVLLNQKDGHLGVLRQIQQQLLQLVDDHGRKAFGRFVENQQFRILQQGARDCQHLLLAAGKLGGAVMPSFLQAGKGAVNAGHRPGTAAVHQAQMFIDRQRRPETPALGAVADAGRGDLVGRQPGKFLAVKTNGPAANGHQPHDRVAQSGFAHAVAPDHRIDAPFQFKIDSLKRMRPAVIDLQSAYPQSVGSAGGFSFSHGRNQGRVAALPDRFRSLREFPL